MSTLAEQLKALLDKEGFVPAPMPQGGDPAMMATASGDPNAAMAAGGGMPMDPAMMAGGGMPMPPPQGDPNAGMPMDPTMMAAAGGGMPPEMMAGSGMPMGEDPNAGMPTPEPTLAEIPVSQFLAMISDVLDSKDSAKQDEPGKEEKKNEVDGRLTNLENMMTQLMQAAGIMPVGGADAAPPPPMPTPDMPKQASADAEVKALRAKTKEKNKQLAAALKRIR